MTIKELKFLKEILIRIKDPDNHVKKALAYVEKDLAMYKARKGQLKDMYETTYDW